MITGCILLIFLGSFCLYNSSSGANSATYNILENWLQSHLKLSKVLGVLLMALGLVMAIPVFGITSGILFWLFTVCIILSLVIVIAPLKNVSYRIVALLILLFLSFELMF